MDKIYQKYIRLTTERMVWTDQVARCIGEHNEDRINPKMLAFMDAQGVIRYVPESEAEFISSKEYFTEVLNGHEFNEHDG
ncbi:MAG: hypothetical protein ACTSPB_12185 [Candidatus Thorarchaeota archaeon]